MPRGHAKRTREGNDFDVHTAARLTDDGYHCVLSHMSKGPADLLAFKPGEIVVVQCFLRSKSEQAKGLVVSCKASPRWNPLWEFVNAVSTPAVDYIPVLAQVDNVCPAKLRDGGVCTCDIRWMRQAGPAPGRGRGYPIVAWTPDEVAAGAA
jgi:hypothetical protein